MDTSSLRSHSLELSYYNSTKIFSMKSTFCGRRMKEKATPSNPSRKSEYATCLSCSFMHHHTDQKDCFHPLFLKPSKVATPVRILTAIHISDSVLISTNVTNQICRGQLLSAVKKLVFISSIKGEIHEIIYI